MVSELLLLGLICLVGYRAARTVPVGRLTALLYVSVVVVLCLGVLWVKSLAAH